MFGADVSEESRDEFSLIKSHSKCLLCKSPLTDESLSLGELPACNHFHLGKSNDVELFSLNVTACQTCQLIQLTECPPISFVTPKFPWIRYNEPDGHLADAAAKLLKLINKNDATAFGVGPFDQPLLTELAESISSCKAIDLLKVEESEKSTVDVFPYLETMQSYLSLPIMQKIVKTHGAADLVICRYLLEHCHDPVASLVSFKPLLKENGYVVIEVPDCTKFIARHDYSFLWEEHITYFTESSLKNLIAHAGYELIEMLKYPGALEDALVAIAKPTSALNPDASLKYADNNSSHFEKYRTSFAKIKAEIVEKLSAITKKQRKIAIFGAGHQAIMFINALKLQDYITYLVDDNPNKQGYFSPGSAIPIVGSEILFDDHAIDVCLLAVSPSLQEKIQHKFSSFIARGGKMYSIFPGTSICHLLEGQTKCA